MKKHTKSVTPPTKQKTALYCCIDWLLEPFWCFREAPVSKLDWSDAYWIIFHHQYDIQDLLPSCKFCFCLHKSVHTGSIESGKGLLLLFVFKQEEVQNTKRSIGKEGHREKWHRENEGSKMEKQNRSRKVKKANTTMDVWWKAWKHLLSFCMLIHNCAEQRQLRSVQILMSNHLPDPCHIPLFLPPSLSSKTPSVQTSSLLSPHSSQLSAISRRIAMKGQEPVWPKSPLAWLCQSQAPCCSLYYPSTHSKSLCSLWRPDRERQWPVHQEEANPAEVLCSYLGLI